MPLLAIAANDVDAAGLTVDQPLPPAWLDAELVEASAEARAPGRVTARLSRAGAEIIVRGKVVASLSLPCARCLDPSLIDVEGELALVLVPDPNAAPAGKSGTKGAAKHKNGKPAREPVEDEHEFTGEEAERDTFDGETVVLDPFVREAILLELPNFPLCSEACPGIRAAPAAPSSPEAERVDPRLAPLGALRARLAQAEASPASKIAAKKPRPKKKTEKE